MAIYGDKEDVSPKFISKERACVGWDFKDAPSLHKLLKHIKVGDLIYIKSHPPTEGLIIKAVGIVVDDKVLKDENLGVCLKVEWVWQGYEVIGKLDDKYNIRNITLYEEFNPDIQNKVIELLLKQTKQ